MVRAFLVVRRGYGLAKALLRRVLATFGYRSLWLAAKIEPLLPPEAAEREARAARFHEADPNGLMRLDYPLDAQSVVFDVGGFDGSWAADIHCRFGCYVEVFEPVAGFAAVAQRRFALNDRVRVHPFGLAGAERDVQVAIDGVSSSAVIARNTDTAEQVHLRSATAVISELAANGIDLMKINIEGGEFELLATLIDAHVVSDIRFLQIQFHEDAPGATGRRDEIRRRLSGSHTLMWEFPWVWESWMRRPLGDSAHTGS